MRWLLFLVALFFHYGSIRAQDDCHYGSEEAANSLIKALTDAPSCSAAVKKLHDCAWGSSADTQFAPIVIQKCEKTFFNKLSPSAQQHYGTEMQLCAYEYARQEGTLSMSAAAMCQVDTAAEFAANPAKANQPEPRASFDCARAQTVLEKAVCSNIPLGHADVVLSRVYSALMKSAGNDVRPRLIENEKAWLKSVPGKCGLSSLPASSPVLRCVRNEFEIRFSWLDSCEDEDAESCLQPPPVEDERLVPATSAPRASFDCEAPSTALEIVICADSQLGQTDIKLAQTYRNAKQAIPVAQQPDFVASEHNWLRYVNRTCPLGAVGGIPPTLTRSCVRSAFEARIQQLESCPQKKSEEQIPCLNEFRLMPTSESPASTQGPSATRVE